MPKLDRIPFFDPRSRQYPIRTLVPQQRRGYTWSVPVELDQGEEGACVGFGSMTEVAARPWPDSSITDADGFMCYRLAQQIDRKEGRNYPEGATVLAGMKALQRLGRIGEYRWAFGESDLALAVGYKGPAVLGTWWWTGMDEPDEDGYLRPTGQRRGGHCYCINSYSLSKDRYGVWNSWGTGFYGWIHREDMVLLLQDEGEAAIPVRRYHA